MTVPMLVDLQRTIRRTARVLTAVPRIPSQQIDPALERPAERLRLFELRGELGAGWHELAVELRGPAGEPVRLLVGTTPYLLPAATNGRADGHVAGYGGRGARGLYG